MSVLRVKNGDQWDIVPAIKGDTGDPAADESITDAMLVPDGIKTEIDWLWGNQLMDIREGELLQTDDAYEGPLVSLDVDGKSTQLITTGKNLFTKEGESAGYINGAGTAVGGNGWMRSTYLPITGGLTYTFNPNSTEGNAAKCALYDANKNVISGAIFASGLNTFDAPNDAEWIRVSYRRNESYDIQLEIGSTATSYEPYSGGVAVPAPDYPQPINSVDNPAMTFAGKNILDPSFFTRCGWIEQNGTYTGTPKQLYQGLTKHILPVNCRQNTRYIFAWYQISSTNTTNANAVTFNFVYSDGTKGVTRYTDLNHEFGPISDVGKTVVGLEFSYVSNPTLAVEHVQLVPLIAWDNSSSIEENYQPYITSATVPLLPDGYSLRSLPDGTKDELHLSYLRPSKREGWAWYSRELVERTQEVVINSGLSQFQANSANHNRVRKKISGSLAGVNHSKCSRFIYNSSTYNYGVPGDYYISAEYAYFIVPDSITTLEEANAWVSDNPIQMVADKSVATVSLDPIELPIMPSKDTTIWSDPSAQLKMTYIQDTNLIIQNLEATVADMATS